MGVKIFSCRKKWRNEFYVLAYEMAKSGMTDVEIAEMLGVKPDTFREWRVVNKAFSEALKRGRSREDSTYIKYVYRQLPRRLQRTWDKINQVSSSHNGAIRIQAILGNKGKRAKQHLFLYAFCYCHFNASKALRKLGMDKMQLNKWIEEDPGFAELFNQIDWHKANYFEEALIKKVKAGDIHAIIFANKTFNKDRGYGEKTQVEVSGTVNHNHQVLTPELLGRLSLECRQELLEVIRNNKALTVESKAIEVVNGS